MPIVLLAVMAIVLPALLLPLRERLTPQQIAGAQRFIAVGPYMIHYSDDGPADGVPLVLLHGFGAWLFTWRAYRVALAAAGRRVICLDLLGAGGSSRPMAARYTTEDQALAMLGALDALGIAAFDLGGHSFGGRVALQIAIDAPQRVRSLALVCPEAFATERPPIGKVTELPLIGAALAYYTLAPHTVRIGLAALSRDPSWLDAAAVAGYAAPLAVQGTAMAQVWQARSPKDGARPVPQHLAEVRCPTLLVWGDGDSVFPAEDGRRLAALLPDGSLLVLPGGHMVVEERADAIIEAILDRASN